MLKKSRTGSQYSEDEWGRKQGEFKEWYDDGQLYTQCFYVNHKLHGKSREWWENGKLLNLCFFDNGKYAKSN